MTFDKVQTYFHEFWSPFQRRSIAQFKREAIDGRVVELVKTDHICFIHRPQKVVGEIRRFLLDDQDPDPR